MGLLKTEEKVMGFFKKIFKGVKKVFKKIGKGIKGVFKGIGKFMNKIGIVGQLALMFLPLGPLLQGLLKGIGGMAANVLTTYGGAIGQSIVNGAKFVISKGAEFAGAVKNTFKTVTDGVTTFASEFTKTSLNKMGFDPTKFGFQEGGNFNQWVKSGEGQSFGDAWNKVTTNITDNASKILDPLKGSLNATSKTTLEGLSDSTYKPIEDIKAMNPQIRDWDNITGQTINLDPDKVSDIISGPSLISRSSVAQAQVPKPSLLDKLGLEPDPAFKPRLEPYVVQNRLRPSGKTPSYLEGLEDLVPPVTPEGWKGVPFKTPAQQVTETSGGWGSLLSMPSAGQVAGQVGIEVLKTAAVDAYRGAPEYSSAGGIPIDFGQADPIQTAQPATFMNVAMEQYAGLRTPNAPFGYTPFNYANYMRT